MMHQRLLLTSLLFGSLGPLAAVELWTDMGGKDGFGADYRTLGGGYTYVTNAALPEAWGQIYGRSTSPYLYLSPGGFAFDYDYYTAGYDVPVITWGGSAFPDLMSSAVTVGANPTHLALTTQTAQGTIQVGIETLANGRLDLVYRTPVAVSHIGGILGCYVTGYGRYNYWSNRAYHPLAHLWGNRLHEASTTGEKGEVRIDLKRPPLAFVLDNGRPIGPSYTATIDVQGAVTDTLTSDKLTITGATLNGTITSSVNTKDYSSTRYLVPLTVDANATAVVLAIDGDKFKQTAYSPYYLGARFTVDRNVPVLTVASAVTAATATTITATATDEQPITWTWALVSGPGKVDLKGKTTSTLDFWADTPGTYVVSCTVADPFQQISTANVSITWNGTTGAFIKDLYTKGLGRTADDAGLFYNGRLADSTSLQQVAIGLLTSPEFRNNPDRSSFQAIIGAAYQALLGRDPDQAGLDGFLAAIGDGQVWPDVVMSLVLSPEFQARHPDAAAPDRLTWEYRMRSELRRIYLITKKRLPTVTELAWIAAFPYKEDYQVDQAKSYLRGQLRDAILPALDQPRPADVVDNLYRLVLNREPDANGRAFWLTRIALGLEVKDLVNTLLDSGEFQNGRWPGLKFPSPPGPDYTIVTSLDEPALLDTWVDISETGTPFSGYPTITTAFPFKLFGKEMTNLRLDAYYGYLTATELGSTSTSTVLQNTGYVAYHASDSTTHYQITANSLTIQYTRFRHNYGPSTDRFTFQTRYFSDGTIQYFTHEHTNTQGYGYYQPRFEVNRNPYSKSTTEPVPSGPFVIEFRPAGTSAPKLPVGNG